MREPALTLFSRGLLSKWGFSDGDEPDGLLDYWEELGIDYDHIDWHTALRELVRKHLLPELRKHHQIQLVDIDTIHNPIRAEHVDGISIDWYQSYSTITLTPESVTVPYSAIARACGL